MIACSPPSLLALADNEYEATVGNNDWGYNEPITLDNTGGNDWLAPPLPWGFQLESWGEYTHEPIAPPGQDMRMAHAIELLEIEASANAKVQPPRPRPPITSPRVLTDYGSGAMPNEPRLGVACISGSNSRRSAVAS